MSIDFPYIVVYFHYMQTTYTIESILGNRSRVAVLRVLRGVLVPLNASQIARHAHLTHPAVTTVLHDLNSMGLVRSSSAGKANVHTLVRENLYVQNIVDPLFAAEEQIPEDILAALRAAFEAQTVSVVLFGSYARGDQDGNSDVDVVLVTADTAAKNRLESTLDNRIYELGVRFGASLSPLTYDLSEAAVLTNKAPELFHSISKDGITVCGLQPWEWTRNG